MDKAQVVVIVIFIAHQYPAEVLQPSEQPLDFPSRTFSAGTLYFALNDLLISSAVSP